MGLADVNSRRDKNVPKEKARSTNRSIFSLAVNSINSLSQRHSDALPESAPSVSAYWQLSFKVGTSTESNSNYVLTS
jgi:hypothetical protein